MDTFFEDFEGENLGAFKRFPEEQRERIIALFTKETEDAQAKLEAEALKKWEEEKKQDEARAADDAKKAAADPKAKKAPPPKKGAGKDPDKPNLDVPKLEVPGVTDFESKMGRKYLYERKIEEIAEKLITPAPLDEETTAKENEGTDREDGTETPAEPDSKLDVSKKGETPAEGEEGAEGEEEEAKEEFLPDVIANDHLDKAALQPPKDPEGEDTLVPDLLVSKDRIIEILEKALEVCLDWLIVEKGQYNQKCIDEGK